MQRFSVLLLTFFILAFCSMSQAASNIDMINGKWEIDWAMTIGLMKENGQIPEEIDTTELIKTFELKKGYMIFDTKNNIIIASDADEELPYSVLSSKGDNRIILETNGEQVELLLYKEGGKQYMNVATADSTHDILVLRKN